MKSILLVSLWVVTLNSQAQFKNVMLAEATAERAGSGPVVAISLKDSKNIVASTYQNTIHSSIDGGQTWTKSNIESSLSGTSVMISDFKGDIFFFHSADLSGKNILGESSNNKIVVKESTDNGLTWSDETFIGLAESKVQSRQRAWVDRKGNFYVTWTQFDAYASEDSACHSNVMLSRSSNGRKWADPIQISTEGDCKDDDTTPRGAVTAVNADGKNVYIAWSNQGKIYLDRSMDGGGTWLSNDILIAEQVGGWRLNVPGMRRYTGEPTLVCDNTKKGKLSGVLYLIYSDQRHGEADTDIWFMRSVNAGDNWTQAIQISAGDVGKHQYSPKATIDPSTGYLYILYYDRSKHDDLQTDVYLAYSMDGGTTFENVKISEQPFVADDQVPIGEGMSIAANDGIIVPIWTRTDKGKSSVWTVVIQHDELEKSK